MYAIYSPSLLLHADIRSQAKCEGLNPICLIFQAFGADAHARTEGIQKAQVLLDGPDIEIGQVGIGAPTCNNTESILLSRCLPTAVCLPCVYVRIQASPPLLASIKVGSVGSDAVLMMS